MSKPIAFSLSKPFINNNDIRCKTSKPWEDFEVWYK